MPELSTAPARRFGRELRAACFDLLFAADCVGCGADTPHDRLCRECRALLERRPAPHCQRCGEPVLAGVTNCGADHRALAGLALHRAPFRYRGTGARLVHRFKFRGDLSAGHWLVRAMAQAIEPQTRGPLRRALVVPVPRHPSKRRTEAFDQATWLARAIADRTGLTLAVGALVRTRPTLPQADPRVTDREANVAGAFACGSPWMVAARDILLIDDVLTSGATARACAAALRVAGAERVALLTAARA
jgi:predicted amidophosphoribosyltransferase